MAYKNTMDTVLKNFLEDFLGCHCLMSMSVNCYCSYEYHCRSRVFLLSPVMFLLAEYLHIDNKVRLEGAHPF